MSWEAGRRARLVSGAGEACSRAERRAVVLTRGPRASVGGVLVWVLGDALEQVGAGRGERAGPREIGLGREEGEGGVGPRRESGLGWEVGFGLG